MARIAHGTLTADSVSTVTLDVNIHTVEILNRDGAAEIFYTVDGSDPTVDGEDINVIPAAVSSVEERIAADEDTVIKLISVGTPKFTVRGF